MADLCTPHHRCDLCLRLYQAFDTRRESGYLGSWGSCLSGPHKRSFAVGGQEARILPQLTSFRDDLCCTYELTPHENANEIRL
jgi:hypothetical protein